MKRIKIGIALISMFGLLLGTASIASAKTVSPVHHAKVSQTSTKSTQHQAKKQTKAVQKVVKQTSKHVSKKA
ncbi:hypothetical protein REC12_16060 [Desulfosporosinus sp. PR]|uniref:hypothetical protein n=1 Tax=Candidatus Desulfosporosinus nitrosoreducens TaxID=3401928 RepID=UPI0027F47553|nr:hypothetical protein [Desulfosporosinus sp. PR]MDQ7095112.1 hypothetical protein [Desulfosporosinus sp. PR]